MRAAVTAFAPDGCPQFAAAIAFHVLLALFPFALLLVTIAGFLLQDDERRADVVAEIVERVPLVADSGVQLDTALAASSAPLGLLGLVGIVTLLWSASGMMAALRHGLNAAWKVERRHTFVRGKLIDVALVVAVDLLVLVAIGLTLLRPLVSGLVDDASLVDAAFTSWLAGTCSSAVRAARRHVRRARGDLPPRARVAARAGRRGRRRRARRARPARARGGLRVYVANFADLRRRLRIARDRVAFLFLVYLSASIVLFGGEVAAAWPLTQARDDRRRTTS